MVPRYLRWDERYTRARRARNEAVLRSHRGTTVTEPALRSWTRSESAISSPHQGGVYRSGLDEVLAKVELTRFRGHPMVGAERSVHDAEEPSAVRAGVPAADRRVGPQRADP